MYFNGVIIPHTRHSYSSGKDKFAEIVWNEYNLAKLILKREWLISLGWIIIISTLRPRQNGRQFADDTYKCIFLNENVWTPIKISLKFVPKVRINNIPALVQIMAWRRPGDKPLSGPMMVRLPTHICATRSQWVKVCMDIRSNFLKCYYMAPISRVNLS